MLNSHSDIIKSIKAYRQLSKERKNIEKIISSLKKIKKTERSVSFYANQNYCSNWTFDFTKRYILSCLSKKADRLQYTCNRFTKLIRNKMVYKLSGFIIIPMFCEQTGKEIPYYKDINLEVIYNSDHSIITQLPIFHFTDKTSTLKKHGDEWFYYHFVKNRITKQEELVKQKVIGFIDIHFNNELYQPISISQLCDDLLPRE